MLKFIRRVHIRPTSCDWDAKFSETRVQRSFNVNLISSAFNKQTQNLGQQSEDAKSVRPVSCLSAWESRLWINGGHEPRVGCLAPKELKKLFEFFNSESHSFLPVIGAPASCKEEPPIWVSGVVALNEEATGLIFEAISMVNSSKKMKKKAQTFLF